MRGCCLLLGLLAACASGPRVEVSAFAPGTPRSELESKTGAARRTKRLSGGQTRATYEVRLVPAAVRSRQSLALHADRAATPGGLALTIHNHGRRDLGQADLAMAAANVAFDYLWRRVSDSAEPARAEREREPPPPRRCRVEVIYDHRGRVLQRRIVPLDDAPTQLESWRDITGPIGSEP
ncbi:MAG: hypothetical protein ACYS0F_16000 [Planctomycetota bacterium]|jgi:hypothetical protein